MKNPYKKYSKINPQVEDGFRQINSSVLIALAKSGLKGSEYSIVLVIIDKTWGYKKLEDCISTSQIQELSGLSVSSIQRSIKLLKEKRIIYYESSGIKTRKGSPIKRFTFNKHYDTWLINNNSKGVNLDTLNNNSKGVKNEEEAKMQKNTINVDNKETRAVTSNPKGVKNEVLRVSGLTDTIYNIQKKDIKDKYIPSTQKKEMPEFDKINYFVTNYIKYISDTFGKLAPKQTDKLNISCCKTVEKLIRLDGFSMNYIVSVIRWSSKDNFWSKQIKSLAGVRKTANNGLTKFQNVANSYEKDNNITGNVEIDNKIANKVFSKTTGKNTQILNEIELS